MSRDRGAEWLLAVWGAATFAALLASYAAFRPVRDALILDGDPEQIPWLFTATFVAITALSPIWGAILGRHPPRWFVPLAFHGFAACLLGFAWLVYTGIAPVAVGRVFYVWSSVFNLFVVSVFWSLLADLLGASRARRLYGPIAAGGTIGAVVGPLLTRLLVDSIDVAGVLVMSAVLLQLAVVGVGRVRAIAWRLDRSVDGEEPITGGALEGLKRVVRSPYLAAIVGYVLCTAIAATFVYLEQAAITKAALPSRIDRTEFFASLDLWTSGATLVVQVVIAAPLLAWVGPGLVLAILPLAQGAGIAALAASPTLATLSVVSIAGRTLTHGLTRPARELLFTVVSRADKYRAKHVIDTVGYRLGDFGSSWLHRGLVATGIGSVALVIAAGPLVLIWLALAVLLGAGFRRRAPNPKTPEET